MASRQTAGHHQLSPLSFRCRHSSVNRIVRRKASFIIASVRSFKVPSAQAARQRGREAERTLVLSRSGRGWEVASPAGASPTGHCVGLFLPAAQAASPAQGLPQRRAFPRGCRRTIRTAGGAKKSNGSKLGNAGKRPRRRGRLQRPLRGAFLACGAGCLAGTGAAAAAARFGVGAGG